MKITWQTSIESSCFHAALCNMEDRQLINQELSRSLKKPIESFRELLAKSGISPFLLMRKMAASPECYENLPGDLQPVIADLRRAYESCLAGVANELGLRSGPIRQQWEARGPGLLARLENLIDPASLADSAVVILVHPAIGGHGVVHPKLSTVCLEAVLANPIPELPEIIRLAWLLAQLKPATPISRRELLSAILIAAEYVDLVPASESLVELAVRAWQVDS